MVAMRPTSCGPGLTPFRWHRLSSIWFIFIVFIAICVHRIDGDKSKNFHIQKLCKTHFLQLVYKKIDGAVLWSQNEPNLDCVVTFQTHSILQRFMLRFDMLQLDCNDHLYIYDGAHVTDGAHKTDLSCRNTKQSVGALITQTNFITLKYVTDGWGTDSNGFKLIITAIKNTKHTCKEFKCATTEFCIHPDLKCDNVNHCGDGSDEVINNLCRGPDNGTLLGIELTWFVLVAVSSVLVICGCIVGIAICFCRRSSNSRENQFPLNQSIDLNGSAKHMHATMNKSQNALYSRQPSSTTIAFPWSGNLHHPAEQLGYQHKIQHKLQMAIACPMWWLIPN